MSDNDVRDELLADLTDEPDAWSFAIELGIGPDEHDRAGLGELPDATRVGADEDVLERLTDAALGRVWDDELESWVREGIVRLASVDGWHAAAERTLAELDRDGRRSEVAREVVRRLAMQLSFDDCTSFFCLDCLDEAVAAAAPGERRLLAVRAAAIAATSAGISASELAAACTAVQRSQVLRLGTSERRTAVRTRLGRLGELGRRSLPALAGELATLGAEPVPERAEDDDVWEAACAHLLRSEVRPELN